MLKLSNGMRVVVRENHAAPLVAVQLWVDVGSADEPPELAGIAHVLEHMAFKGTADRGVGDIAREIEQAGGDINAWTSLDHTVYHIAMPSRFFDRALDVLADAVLHMAIDRDELRKELDVVLEEINESEDSPASVVSHDLFTAAYHRHPYRRPVIGYTRTVRGFDRAAVRGFYRSHYQPQRMTLVVVGDIKKQRAVRRIRDTFGTVKGGRVASSARASEPTQRSLRIVTRQRDTRETYITLGFRIPSLLGDDTAALDIAAVILGQGEASRLVRKLRNERQLVTDISAYAYAPKDPGLLVISATTRPERSVEAVGAIAEEVFALARDGVSQSEIDRARALIDGDAIFQHETVQGQARKLGYFESVAGDPDFEQGYRRRVDAADAGEVRRIAGRYLRPENLTVAVVTPYVDDKLETDLRQAIKHAARPVNKPKGPLVRRSGRSQPQRITLPGGAKLIAVRDPDVPIVAMRAVWLGGVRYETAANNGINSLLATLITRGTTQRTANNIAEDVEGVAGALGGFSGRNSFGLRLEVPAQHQHRGLEILADCICNPTLPADEVVARRRDVLDDLHAQQDDPFSVAMDLFCATAFRRHPYRFSPLGTPTSVRKLTRPTLSRYLQQHYQPNTMVLALAGDLDLDRLTEDARRRFARTKSKQKAPPKPAAEPSRLRPAHAERRLDKEQAQVLLGFPGTTIRSADRFALELIGTVLSAQSGRLFLDLRDQQGLAYRLSAFSQEGVDPGWFVTHVATSPDKVDAVIQTVLAHYEALRERVIPLKELRRAQHYLVGGHEVSMQRRSALTAMVAFDEIYGLGWSAYQRYPREVMNVTPEQIRRVATRYFDPQRLITTVVRPGDQTKKST